MKPILGAYVTAYVVFFLGVTYVFGPAMANDAPTGPMGPTWLTLGIASVFFILCLDWVNQSVRNPVRSGMIMALPQILLVDVYYVLNGTRGVTPALISAVLLLVGWGAAGAVYGKLSGQPSA